MVPGEKPRFSAQRSLVLFSLEDWTPVTFLSLWETLLRINPAALEVKGSGSTTSLPKLINT